MKRPLLFFAVALSGCVSMYGTPEQREIRNTASSSLELCKNLAIATLAPADVRSEWGAELQRRDEDCSAYAANIANAQQQNQALINSGAALMAASAPRPLSAPVAPPASIASIGRPDYVSGQNRICFYEQYGSESAYTISANRICPPRPPTYSEAAGPAQYTRSYVSGENRLCFYDQYGSEFALTISALSICPLAVGQ